MPIPEADLFAFLSALLALLLVAHGLGNLAQQLHQPRVIGEILAGVILGPSVLGSVFPQIYTHLFASGSQQVLGYFFAFGLLLLMFCAGLETKIAVRGSEWKLIASLTLMGTLFPLGIGLLAAGIFGFRFFWGPQASWLQFGLVLALSLGVAAIPIIGKIFFDLGLSRTPFAHTVLTVAMIGDLILWALLSMTLQAAGKSPTDVLLGVLVTVLFFVGCYLWGPSVVDALFSRFHQNGASLFLVFIGVVLLAYLCNVNPIFGAFISGQIVARSKLPSERKEQAAWFSNAFFTPLYFASLGLYLDLRHGISLLALLAVLVLYSLVKVSSSYFAARVAGENNHRSLHLAIALNARGGPGIVLAAVALGAGIITQEFYIILVLVSLFTAQMAGWWLFKAKKRFPGELGLVETAD